MSLHTAALKTLRISLRSTAKTFTLADLLPEATKVSKKNLVELIQPYPTQGIGFKARKHSWPAGKYYLISDVHSTAKGTQVSGVLFENNQPTTSAVSLIGDAGQKGSWRYEIAESTVQLDNGLVYTPNSMLDYWQSEVSKGNTDLVGKC
jgi:hypothetical protein